jgi:hypothetical protein
VVVEPGLGEDIYEEIFEVCCEFLDERFPGNGVDGHSADHINRKGKEEDWEFYDERRACSDYAEWSNDGADNFSRCDFCNSADCDRADPAEHNDHHGSKDDGWTGQTYDSGAAAVVSNLAFWIRRSVG